MGQGYSEEQRDQKNRERDQRTGEQSGPGALSRSPRSCRSQPCWAIAVLAMVSPAIARIFTSNFACIVAAGFFFARPEEGAEICANVGIVVEAPSARLAIGRRLH